MVPEFCREFRQLSSAFRGKITILTRWILMVTLLLSLKFSVWVRERSVRQSFRSEAKFEPDQQRRGAEESDRIQVKKSGQHVNYVGYRCSLHRSIRARTLLQIESWRHGHPTSVYPLYICRCIQEDGITRVLSSSWASMSITKLIDCCEWELSLVRVQCFWYDLNLGYELGCEFLALCEVKLGIWLVVKSVWGYLLRFNDYSNHPPLS